MVAACDYIVRVDFPPRVEPDGDEVPQTKTYRDLTHEDAVFLVNQEQRAINGGYSPAVRVTMSRQESERNRSGENDDAARYRAGKERERGREC